MAPRRSRSSRSHEVARRRAVVVRRVGELAELAADEERRLLADVDRVVADPLEAARDDDHAQAPLAEGGVAAQREDVADDAPVGAVDQLVEVDERLGPRGVAVAERVERDADHLLGPLAHLLEALEERLVVRDVLHELGQLGDRHAVVGHPLEVEVVVEDGEHEPQVDGDRRLPGEERLDALLDREVGLVDLVVEGDHLVGQLDVRLHAARSGSRGARGGRARPPPGAPPRAGRAPPGA